MKMKEKTIGKRIIVNSKKGVKEKRETGNSKTVTGPLCSYYVL